MFLTYADTRSMTRLSGYTAFNTLELDGNTNVLIHLGHPFSLHLFDTMILVINTGNCIVYMFYKYAD